MHDEVPRVVLDTNSWLDLLWFRDPRCCALADAIGQRRLQAVSSAACRAEWQRVLAYPQLRIDPATGARLGAAFDAQVQLFAAAPPTARLPRCRDADDQKFLEVALQARAAVLFTRDHELLRLSPRLQRAGMFAVVEPWHAARHFGWHAAAAD